MKKKIFQEDQRTKALALANKAVQALQAKNFRSLVMAKDIKIVRRDINRVIDYYSDSVALTNIMEFKNLVEFCNAYLAIPPNAFRVSRNIGSLFASLNLKICNLLTKASHEVVSYEGI